jgi:hypothetical protein
VSSLEGETKPSLPLCIDLPGVSLPGADRLKPGETPGHGMATETLWQ